MKAQHDTWSSKRSEIRQACMAVLGTSPRKSNLNRLAALGLQTVIAAGICAPLANAADDAAGTANASGAPEATKESWIRFEGTDMYVGKAPPVTFHGFFSQGFLYSDNYNYLAPNTTDGSFEFREIGVNFSMNPLPKTRITMQGFAFDIGDVGDFIPFLDYGSIEYTFNDYIGVRGGRVRRPGGIYNAIQDVDLARTYVLLPQGIYDARWRDFSASVDGGLIYGTIPIGKAGSIGYEAYAGVTNMDAENGGVAAWITDGSPGAVVTSFNQPLYAGGQFWWYTPLDGLRVGASVGNMFDFGYNLTTPVSPVGPFGPVNAYTTGAGDVFFQQYSLEYVWNSWTFQGEFYTWDFDGTNTTSVQSGTTPIQPTSVGPAKVNPYAWYVGAQYRVNSWMETGAYYTQYIADYEDGKTSSPNSFQNDLALSLRFDPFDWWIWKIEGHMMKGTALLRDAVNNPPAERNDDLWYMLAIKTTLSF